MSYDCLPVWDVFLWHNLFSSFVPTRRTFKAVVFEFLILDWCVGVHL